jgi:triacylglycerol lipase
MNIVLVHGILGFGRIGPIDYFNGVADHLRQRFEARVYAPALDPTAGTETRSTMLRKSIQDAVSRGGSAPRNQSISLPTAWEGWMRDA